MPRPYVLRARAETATRTRAEIIKSARQALLASERLDFSVGEVAAAAGVARSTVYAAVGSRAELLSALADDALHSSGLDEVISAFMNPDAVVALEDSLRASCRMYGAEHRLFRRLLALGEVDPEAAAPIARSAADRAQGMSSLAERLAAQGRLRAGLSVEHAADTLALVSSFGAFDELFTGRGLDADSTADLLIDVARRSVLAAHGS
jgi:AcrR family transcriptional regulator